jgi:hypothetical protein
LLPGFVLTYDMVFTPSQSMLPAWLGLDGGLPRAVPQDALVSLASAAVDGAWLQKIVLISTLLLIGVGAARLAERGVMSLSGVRPSPSDVAAAGVSRVHFGTHPQMWAAAAGVMAATLAIWNPFVAQRLIQGHWSLLLAYGVAFWAVGTVMAVRQPGGQSVAQQRSGARVIVLLLAACAITPFGGLLAVLIVVPAVLLPGGVLQAKQRVGITVGALLVNLPWLIPSVAHPLSRFADPQGAEFFALRAEGPWGPWVTALGGGGIWNTEVVLISRTWWPAAVFAIVLTAAAIIGFLSMRSATPDCGWDRRVAKWLLICAGLGLTVAVVPAVIPEFGLWISESIPGGGLLRDSAKLLVPWMMVLAVFAPVGVCRFIAGVHSRHRDPTVSGALVALVIVLPLAVMPDFVWGAQGRLAAVAYPQEWQEVRDFLAEESAPGDVLSLPWSTFRQYEFNAKRTVLDPMPRWLTRSSVANDELLIARGNDIVAIAGDDPRSREISDALAGRTPLIEVLPGLNIGWVVVQKGQLPEVPELALAGLIEVLDSREFIVYAVPGPVEAAQWPAYAGLVIAVDLAVLVMIAALLASVGVSRWAQVFRSKTPSISVS